MLAFASINYVGCCNKLGFAKFNACFRSVQLEFNWIFKPSPVQCIVLKILPYKRNKNKGVNREFNFKNIGCKKLGEIFF